MGTVRSMIVLGIATLCIFKIANATEKEWWETTTIYQIYPRSFMDTNGDGVGDINGIYEKLDYIKDIGIETIWIQPFYKSPMADTGYDISDFKEIDPMFGDKTDFTRLVAGVKERKMKLILDFVPNHVSDECEWFVKSVNREKPFDDFFIWHDAKGYNKTTKQRVPPSNWLSVFEGSAWRWNDKRKQFYYAPFSDRQPDLNYRNPVVRKYIRDCLRYWLDLGVDGFRLDSTKFLFEREDLMDEPYISPDFEGSLDYSTQLHIYTTDLDEVYDVMHEWRMLVDEYKAKDGKTRIICSEAYTELDYLIKYFGNETYKGVHFPFYFGLVSVNLETNATRLDQMIHEFMDAMPEHGVANWVISNHDNVRLAGRVCPDFIDAMNMVELLLPGIASIYYGDEIGMQETILRRSQIRDPNNAGSGSTMPRDGARSPMQWDNTINAGFTKNNVPWLPVHSNYWFKNVKTQSQEPHSHLNIFKQLIEMRKTPVIKHGKLYTCALSTWMYLFVRKQEGEPTVVVIINLGSESLAACAKDCFKYLPDVMDVHLSSVNSAYKPGDKFAVTHTDSELCSVLRPKAGVVLMSNHQAPSSATSVVSSSLILISLALLLFTSQF